MKNTDLQLKGPGESRQAEKEDISKVAFAPEAKDSVQQAVQNTTSQD